jgi:hypothetical protein
MGSLEIFSVACAGHGFTHPGPPLLVQLIDNRDNHLTPCQAYQQALESTDPDILVYAHDDVKVHDEKWLEHIVTVFDDHPNCVAVGLGGALSLGHPDLYRTPYRIQNMARGNYMSNQDDWEIHGKRETGTRRVAVLDAFLMAVRRDFLLSVGGWPVKHLTHHCLDLWLACEAARAEKEIYMVGCSVLHSGGGTSTNAIYATAQWKQGGTLETDHQAPHRWLAETYRDVLPITL